MLGGGFAAWGRRRGGWLQRVWEGHGVCGAGRGLCNGGKKRRGMVATGFVSGWPNGRVGGVTAVRPPVGVGVGVAAR